MVEYTVCTLYAYQKITLMAGKSNDIFVAVYHVWLLDYLELCVL